MERILLGHGSGGRLMHSLIDALFMRELGNKILREKKDSAILDVGGKRIAFTTDSYVVNPIIFPGGDIGSLAVYGTVNDLSVVGACPKFISLGLIIEEGLDKAILDKVVVSIRNAAKKSKVEVVTGDTKVVEKGSCDKIFVNTSGIGEIYYEGLSAHNIRAGDHVIISGSIGEHAISIMAKRECIKFKTKVLSDHAPLNGLIKDILHASNKIRFMRDPTRGGVATTLNEIVDGMGFGIAVEEDLVPVRDGVRDAAELLGLDPLYLACEGRVIILAPGKDVKKILSAMSKSELGKNAKVIGTVTRDYPGRVVLNTSAGGKRILDMLLGEQLPRIC